MFAATIVRGDAHAGKDLVSKVRFTNSSDLMARNSTSKSTFKSMETRQKEDIKKHGMNATLREGYISLR